MNEYISRDEVLSRIYATHSTGGFANEEAYLWIHDEITNLSAADVQPVKHGRWILCDDGYVRCSECNRKAFIENDETILTDFCHGCGADMRMDGDSDA